MSRQASKNAQDNFSAATAKSNQYGADASKSLGAVQPFLQKELTNPTGYDPSTMARLMTSSEQGLGGATSAVNGTGALMAARNRNAAGLAPALDESARAAMRQGSQNTLGIQADSANLANQKQQTAATGLQSLYGTNTQAVLNALGAGTNAVNAENTADAQTQSTWMTPLTSGMNAAASYFGARK